MDGWPIDWTGLSDEQKKAVERLVENQKEKLFIGTFPQQIAEDFRRANQLKESPNSEERERGARIEDASFAQCGCKP